jgi:hypothetical protein
LSEGDRLRKRVAWSAIQADFEATGDAFKVLARRHPGVSWETIRVRARDEGWQRPGKATARAAATPKVAEDAGPASELLSLGRQIATGMLTGLAERPASLDDLEQAASALRNLSVAIKGFADVPPRAEPAPPPVGQRATAREAAGRISSVGKYKTPTGPPSARLVVDNVKPGDKPP